jgi:hypothetical protein
LLKFKSMHGFQVLHIPRPGHEKKDDSSKHLVFKFLGVTKISFKFLYNI